MADQIDSLLDGTGEDAAAIEAARQAAEATAAAEQAEADRLAAEQQAAAVVKEEQDAHAKAKAFEKAMLDERRKRQELEQQLLAAQQPKVDEDEYASGIKAELRQEYQQALINERYTLSEMMTKDKYADYDEKYEIFAGLVKENAALYYQMIQQANPCGFIYKTASNHLNMADPDAYSKKLRAEIEAEVTAKIKKQLEEEAAKRGELPGTIATTRGVAGTHAAEWTGPPPLSDVLG